MLVEPKHKNSLKLIGRQLIEPWLFMLQLKKQKEIDYKTNVVVKDALFGKILK